MIKIVCTSEKEKLELIEAAEYLSKQKGIDVKTPGVNFLINLYRNPGDIEVADKVVVRKPYKPHSNGYKSKQVNRF